MLAFRALRSGRIVDLGATRDVHHGLPTPPHVMARQTSFYYSFKVLPPDQRRAIEAVWDFCRAVDDAVDEPPIEGHTFPTGREAIAFWREELALCFGAGTPRTRQGQRLQPCVAAFDLPRPAFEDVIDGVAMDLDTTRYETFADLYEYCRRVASAIGMICIQIFGCRSEKAREYALNLGLALQLTNILRDVTADWQRGRLYLPLEDMRAVGCSVEALSAGVMTDPVRRVIEHECRRAREFYRRAAQALPVEDRGRLVASEIMRAVYSETLNRIELVGYDIFAMRTRPPRVTQAVIALKQWLWRL
jgi:phytoene synthase